MSSSESAGLFRDVSSEQSTILTGIVNEVIVETIGRSDAPVVMTKERLMLTLRAAALKGFNEGVELGFNIWSRKEQDHGN